MEYNVLQFSPQYFIFPFFLPSPYSLSLLVVIHKGETHCVIFIYVHLIFWSISFHPSFLFLLHSLNPLLLLSSIFMGSPSPVKFSKLILIVFIYFCFTLHTAVTVVARVQILHSSISLEMKPANSCGFQQIFLGTICFQL